MKNIFISITIIAVSLATMVSCSIYEELHFLENGHVKYRLTFDGKKLMEAMPNESSTDTTVKDSIISIADIIYANKDIKKTLYPQEKEDLANISAFVIKKHEDPAKKEYTFSITGEFTDTEALNKALYSLNRLVGWTQSDAEISESIGEKKLMDQLSRVPQYKWDSVTMKRYTVESEKLPDGKKESSEEDKISKAMGITNPFTSFLMGGKMTVKYHFPSKVERTDNTEAMLSLDGKTVILNYDATIFSESPEDANINIIIKK